MEIEGPALFAGIASPSAAAKNNGNLSQTLKFVRRSSPDIFFDDTDSVRSDVPFSNDFVMWLRDIAKDDENTWRDKVSTEFKRLIHEQKEDFDYPKRSFSRKKKKNKKIAANTDSSGGAAATNGADLGMHEATTMTTNETTGAAPSGTPEETKEPKNWKKYSEQQLKALLNLLSNNFELADTHMGIHSKYNGSPDNVLSLAGKSYVLGEFKHGPQFAVTDALYQLSMYLLLELFWLRAIQRCHTEEVYGFVMLGPNCKDIESSCYAICLVRAEIPIVLGEQIHVSYWMSTQRLIDLQGYKYVYNFLKLGKRSDWNMKIKEQDGKQQQAPNHSPQIQPSLLYIPNKTLSLVRDDLDIELVPNGTCAIVFKTNSKSAVERLFDQTEKAEEIKRRKEAIRKKRDIYRKNFNSLKDGSFYVKIRTINMNCGWDARGQANSLNSAIREAGGDLSGLYPIRTYADSTMMFIVMNNMGVPPTKESLRNLENTISMFSELVARTLNIADNSDFHHGDALLHNCLLRQQGSERGGESRFLELIDFDEGGHKIAERDVESLPTDVDFRYCRYPDSLSSYYTDNAFPWHYTVVQLSVLFHQLSSFFDNEPNESKTAQTVQDVRDKLKVVETMLSGRIDDHVALHKAVDSLYSVLPTAGMERWEKFLSP